MLFRSPQPTELIYLHLFHEPGYIYLNEDIGDFKAFRKVASEEQMVKNKVSHYCQAEQKTPSYILKSINQVFHLVSEGIMKAVFAMDTVKKKMSVKSSNNTLQRFVAALRLLSVDLCRYLF